MMKLDLINFNEHLNLSENRMTQEELKAKLEEVLGSDRELCENFMFTSDDRYIGDSDFSSITDLGITINIVHHHGGEEQGRAYYSIVKFSFCDVSVLAKFEGSYASYHGADYESWRFVEAKKVEVTRYV